MKKIVDLLHRLCLVAVPFLFVMASCEEELIGPRMPNTPSGNFEYFWKTFDTHYGMFDVKNIDWNAIVNDNRSLVNDQMTEAELYQVLTSMMNPLNDNHLNLYPTNGTLPVYPGGIFRWKNGQPQITKVQTDYDLEVVKKYLLSYEQLSPSIGVGKLPQNRAYVNIKGTDGMKLTEKVMEKVAAEIANASGVIVDIRGFYGGFDPVSQRMASYFASERKLYMTTRKRNGTSHEDFTQPVEWFVEPRGNAYTRPVVLLTSQFTQSAGETFALALTEFDHVVTLGDTTAGSFSDNPNFELPNGWIFSVSVGDYRASNGKSYEGVGLIPDTAFITTRENLLAGVDKALEKAMEQLSH